MSSLRERRTLARGLLSVQKSLFSCLLLSNPFVHAVVLCVNMWRPLCCHHRHCVSFLERKLFIWPLRTIPFVGGLERSRNSRTFSRAYPKQHRKMVYLQTKVVFQKVRSSTWHWWFMKRKKSWAELIMNLRVSQKTVNLGAFCQYNLELKLFYNFQTSP